MQEFDTSTLGPIKIEHDRVAARAKVVREALRSMSNAPAVGAMFNAIAAEASDETLAKLARMIRS